MLSKVSVGLLAVASPAVIGAANNNPYAVTKYTVPLVGYTVSNIAHPAGGVGDPDGSGSVTLTINAAKKRLCYKFALSKVSTPLIANIHEGPPLRNGPPVVTLFTGPGGKLDNCVTWTHRQLAQIVAYPSDFYVDVSTTEFPDGALRGQLSRVERG